MPGLIYQLKWIKLGVNCCCCSSAGMALILKKEIRHKRDKKGIREGRPISRIMALMLPGVHFSASPPTYCNLGMERERERKRGKEIERDRERDVRRSKTLTSGLFQ